MPTVDIWGVLTGIKNVVSFVFSSRVGILVATGAFLLATLATFWAFWAGFKIPSVNVSSLGVSQEFTEGPVTNIFLYCVHADYVVSFLNFLISFINAFVPFVSALIFSALIFKFGVFLKHAIGADIKQAN